MNYKLEVIGFTIESCSIAQESGAHRIELCDNASEGGTTPSYGFIKAARKQLSISLYPIIRPRGGDFLYSKDEFEIMKTDIAVCKKLGCDGVVTGLLNADGTVDKKRCSQLVDLAYPLEVTFHRAFDRTVDPLQGMEDVIETGCERILTSGQTASAADGMQLISSLIQKSAGRIIIMPGSGVRSVNIAEIATTTKATEFHTSARTMMDSKMKVKNEKFNEQLSQVTADGLEIIKMTEILARL